MLGCFNSFDNKSAIHLSLFVKESTIKSHAYFHFVVLDVKMLFVNRAYKSCGPGGPPHVKIVVEWDKETKD